MKTKKLVSVILFTLTSCAAPMFKPSDHCDGEKFHNTGGNPAKGFGQVLKWKLTTKAAEWPDWVENKYVPHVLREHRSNGTTESVAVTFINHATFLVQIDGVNIITDPIYSERASPFTWIGPKRVRAPGVPFDQLPTIHVVVISHNHHDHMNPETLKKLHDKFKPRFLVPLGNKALLEDWGIENVTEFDWWEPQEINSEVKIYLTPAQHWSARGMTDQYRALWGGYLIATPKTRVFFAGDTGYGDHFKQIKERLGAIDVALLPIGAYAPRWFMREAHMNPDDAVQAHLDLHAKHSVGMHFGTFQLTDEAIDDPIKELATSKKTFAVENFETLEFGETKIY